VCNVDNKEGRKNKIVIHICHRFFLWFSLNHTRPCEMVDRGIPDLGRCNLYITSYFKKVSLKKCTLSSSDINIENPDLVSLCKWPIG